MNLQPSKYLVILGAGGHAVSIANIAHSAGYIVKYFIDPYAKSSQIIGIDVLRDLGDIPNLDYYSYCVALGDNFLRQKLYQEIIDQYPNLLFPPLVHDSAVISIHTKVGDGTVVMPGAIVGPNSTVGKFCILNTNASIDHDCVMADYSSIAPGVVTGGRVNIGLRSAVSIGAVIKHGLTIGHDVVIGANSYLNFDIPSMNVAYGSPARIIRPRVCGDKYLS
jgi:sugar O-acyltransferase (sialic acid O-acetyltransferase NeuD family)